MAPDLKEHGHQHGRTENHTEKHIIILVLIATKQQHRAPENIKERDNLGWENGGRCVSGKASLRR